MHIKYFFMKQISVVLINKNFTIIWVIIYYKISALCENCVYEHKDWSCKIFNI